MNEYDYNDKMYTSLSISSYLTMEIYDKKSQHDISKSIMITDKNIFSVITATNTIIKNIYDNPIYATDRGKLIIYEDLAEKFKVIRHFSNGAIMYKPVIIYDENDVSYEGARLCINNSGNYVDLTIESLEALRYCLTKIDFIAYSQLLYNYYELHYGGDVDVVKKKPEHYGGRPHIDWGFPTQQTTATFSRKKDDIGFDKLLNP